MLSKLIRINKKIQSGCNRIGWIQTTLTGSGIIGVLIHSISPGAAVPSTLILFSGSAVTYYMIEHTHDLHDKEKPQPRNASR